MGAPGLKFQQILHPKGRIFPLEGGFLLQESRLALDEILGLIVRALASRAGVPERFSSSSHGWDGAPTSESNSGFICQSLSLQVIKPNNSAGDFK